MTQIGRWMRGVLEQRRPRDHPTLDLPDDWVAVRIPYERQALSRAQWKAVRRLRGRDPTMKLECRKSREELSLEERIGHWVKLRQDKQETAIHIQRETIPTKRAEDNRYGAARNKRAVEAVNETLAAFPAEQIEISRISDFSVAAPDGREWLEVADGE